MFDVPEKRRAKRRKGKELGCDSFIVSSSQVAEEQLIAEYLP